MRLASLSSGDVVDLTSGGPDMTVESIEGEKATCVWWDEDQQTFRRETFGKGALRINEDYED